MSGCRSGNKYGIREHKLAEVDDVPYFKISTRIERLPELIKGYEMKDILNVDELALFFKVLPDKTLVERPRKCKGGQKPKQRLTATFFVASDGSKVGEPVVIWKSQLRKCFQIFQNKM